MYEEDKWIEIQNHKHTIAFVIIVPALFYSYRAVKGDNYSLHKRIQLTLFSLLFVAVILFEVDLRQSGGIFKLVAPSRYAGTALLNGLIYIHMLFSITSSFIWIGLVVASLLKFPSPPAPNSFSGKHIFWGRLGMIDMALAGITGIMLYIWGFAY